MTSTEKDETPIGRWFGNSSAKPLDQLEQFNVSLGTFVKERSDEADGATVFRCHPGVRTIALTDHASGAFFVNAPRNILEREPIARFGGVALDRYAVGNALPTLVDAGGSHDLTRCMTQRIMQQRHHLLEPAIDLAFTQFAKRWESLPSVTLINELQELSVLIVWQWLLGVMPNQELIRLWHRDCVRMTADTSYGRLLAKQRVDGIAAEAREASETLLHTARTSPAWPAWEQLAAEHDYPLDQLAHLCVFLCTFNGIAPGRSLFPTVLKLRQDQSLRQKLQGLPADFATIDQDRFLEATMVEATRLFTRPRFAVKIAQCDFSLPSSSGINFAISKGERLMAIYPVLHRDPARFTEPEKFDPDRYLRDPELTQHVFGYLTSPNSQNPYGCAAIGNNRFGPTVWKMLLQRLVSRATWKPSVEPRFGVNQLFDAGPSNIQMNDFQIACID